MVSPRQGWVLLLALGLSLLAQFAVVVWQPPLAFAFHLAQINGVLLLVLLGLTVALGDGWAAPPLLGPLLAGAGWMALSLIWTADRWTGIQHAANLILPVSAFLLATALCRRSLWRHRLAGLCLIVAGLVAAYGLLVFGGLLPAAFNQTSRNAAPFVNPDDAAYVYEMFLPLAAVLFFIERRPLRRIATAYAFGLLAVAHVLTMSRGGWFALAFSLLVLLFLLRLRQETGSRRIALAGGILIVAWAALRIGDEPLMDRIETLSPEGLIEHVNERGSRPDLWRTALPMIARRPIHGWGVNGYDHAFPFFRQAGQYIPPEVTQSVHNDYLDVTVSYGLVGLALLAWIIRSFLVEARRSWGRARSAHNRLIQAAAFAGVLAVMLHSAFEFGLVLPAIALPFAVLAALALQTGDEAKAAPWGWGLVGLGVLLLGLLGVAATPIYRGEMLVRQGKTLLEEGRLADAEAAFIRACTLMPGNARPWRWGAIVSLRRASLARAIGLHDLRRKLALEGEERASQAEERDGYALASRLIRAHLLSHADPDRALALSEQLWTLAPHDPEVAMLHGFLLVRQGRRDEGRQVIRRILEEAEASGHLIRRIPRLVELFPALADLEDLIPPALLRSRRALIAALERAKRWADAEVLLAKLAVARGNEEPGLWLRLAGIRGRLGRYDEAVEATDRAVALAPDAKAHAMRARMLDGAGRRDEATEAWKTAATLAPDDLGPALSHARHLPDVEALEALAALARRFPDAASPHVARAEIHGRRNELFEALKSLVEATNRAPADRALRDRLAVQYDRVDLPHKAVETWQTMIRERPEDTLPWRRLVVHHWQRKEWGDCRQALEALQGLAPEARVYGRSLEENLTIVREREAAREARRAFPRGDGN